MGTPHEEQLQLLPDLHHLPKCAMRHQPVSMTATPAPWWAPYWVHAHKQLSAAVHDNAQIVSVLLTACW